MGKPAWLQSVGIDHWEMVEGAKGDYIERWTSHGDILRIKEHGDEFVLQINGPASLFDSLAEALQAADEYAETNHGW